MNVALANIIPNTVSDIVSTMYRVLLLWLIVVLIAASARADIFRWDNGQVIPGTEGIMLAPGVEVVHHELPYAQLGYQDLSNSRFDFSDLSYASVDSSTLTNASLRGVNLANAVVGSTLTNADLSGANLANANLNHSTFTNASLSGANLANAYLYSTTLMNADLGGAVVTGAYFNATTSLGFTKEQLYSTASYQAKSLSGLSLGANDLTGWKFNGQNLANASLDSSTLTNADLSEAAVQGVNFQRTTSRGFTKEQLYSTASYQAKNLPRVWLNSNDLAGWDFNGQNLADAYLYFSTLTNANLNAANLTNADLNFSTLINADLGGADLTHAFLSSATLTNANLQKAVVTGAGFWDTTSHGFTKEQLYSTASYEARNVAGIGLAFNDLGGWDFNGQNLANASLDSSTLTNANLSFADLRGAGGLDASGANTRNMIWPDGSVQGLGLVGGDVLAVRNYRFSLPISVQDHLTMSNGSILQAQFDVAHWDSTISFAPGIPVTLGGSLELMFATDVDVASQSGRTFHIFDWSGVKPTGQFEVASPYAWDVSNLYTTGEVTLLLPGDTNGDQTVDLVDLNNVRNNFGGSGHGDTNNDGNVDLADLNNVRNFFGISSPQAVPELSSVTLLALGAAGIAARRRMVRR